MNIEIHSLMEGLKEAKGIVVIIDVLRACTTIPILFQQGATEVIPVRTLKEVEEYKQKGYILIGEIEEGRVHNIFNYNNSPSEVCDKDFSGKKVVLRTNNATQAILNAKHTLDIVLASFVNLNAVVKYIQDSHVEDITLVPLGRLGKKGLEDELCAEAIKSRLEGSEFDFENMSKRIYKSECAVLVRDTLKRPYDVTIALKLNSYSIVPRIYSENNHKVIRVAK